MTERIPDYKLPPEAEMALAKLRLPGRYLPMPAVVMLRCAACHLNREEEVTATNVAKCTQMDRSNVSHGLTKLVRRGLLESENVQTGTGYPNFGFKVYDFTDVTRDIARILPPLSHCEYVMQARSAE